MPCEASIEAVLLDEFPSSTDGICTKVLDPPPGSFPTVLNYAIRQINLHPCLNETFLRLDALLLASTIIIAVSCAPRFRAPIIDSDIGLKHPVLEPFLPQYPIVFTGGGALMLS